MQEYVEFASEVGKNILNFCNLKKRQFPESQSLEGQVIVITGANRSSGKEAALICAQQGAQVVMACRNRTLAEAVEHEIIAAGHRAPITVQLDLCSFESIVRAADELKRKLPRIDVIIHNAAMISKSREITEDNIEATVQANYVGAFVLTENLLPLLLRSSDGKIIFVSSIAHHAAWKNSTISPEELFEQKQFSTYKSYAESKAAALMYCRTLGQMYPSIKCYAVDPGMFSSDILREKPRWIQYLVEYNIVRPFIRTPREASQSIVAPLFLPSHPYDADKFFFGDGKHKKCSEIICDDEKCALVYQATRLRVSEYLPTDDANRNGLYPTLSVDG